MELIGIKNLLLIVNPGAGKKEIKNNLADIIDIFVKADYRVVVRTTQYSGEIIEIINNIGIEYDIVVCCGGDGTLNEAVNAVTVMEREGRPHLGYIPSGTVNDFATSHGISKDPLKAARSIVEGSVKHTDLGVIVSGEFTKYFAYVAAFGLFTDVAYSTSQQQKNNFGRMAYIVEGIKRLSHINSYKMSIESDELNISDDEFIYGMLTNAKTVGGMKLAVSSDVSLSDGLMEVTLIKQPKNMVGQKLINALLAHEADSDLMYHFQTSRIRVVSDEAVAWTLDGEFGGMYSDVELRTIKGGLEIVYF